MNLSLNVKQAIAKVNRRGMLLVFPMANRKEPASLWHEFFPRTEMRWEWDDQGDNRVAELWHLRERLSTSKKVVYTKWFRGRATLVSFELFTALLHVFGAGSNGPSAASRALSFQAREILDILEEDSPLSTKQLKRLSGLQGRESERVYNSALKELWISLLISAFGEVDEGAFPSLAIGSTRVLFEELWRNSQEIESSAAQDVIDTYLPLGSSFRKYFDQVQKQSRFV